MTDTASRRTTGSDPDSTPADRSHRSLPLNKAVFAAVAVAVVAFVLWGALTPGELGETTTTLAWLEKTFGWLFVLTTAAFVIFSGYLALSRYGNIRLGPVAYAAPAPIASCVRTAGNLPAGSDRTRSRT